MTMQIGSVRYFCRAHLWGLAKLERHLPLKQAMRRFDPDTLRQFEPATAVIEFRSCKVCCVYNKG